QAAATDSFEQMQVEANLADRFREDIAAARASPEFGVDFEASPLCMILRDKSDAFIIYRSLDGQVERVDMRNQESHIESYRLGGSDSVAEFGRRGRVLTMTLRGPQRGTLTIAAALG